MNPLVRFLFYNRVMNYNAWSLRQFVKRVAARVPGGASLVDVGAGESPYKPLFSHTAYVSTDWGGTSDHHAYSSGIDFICPADNMPFADNAYDFVLCTQVLEHVRYPEKSVQEMARVLQPGGQLFLSAPQSWEEHEVPHDYHRFTRYALRAYAEDAGLEVVSIQPQGGRFITIGYFLAWSLPVVFGGWFGRPGFVAAGLLFYPLNFSIALLFQLLDVLDRNKEITLTYECIFTKK